VGVVVVRAIGSGECARKKALAEIGGSRGADERDPCGGEAEWELAAK
jgi:hypothetical protein